MQAHDPEQAELSQGIGCKSVHVFPVVNMQFYD